MARNLCTPKRFAMRSKIISDKSLIRSVNAYVSNRINLGVGNVLAVDTSNPDLTEYLEMIHNHWCQFAGSSDRIDLAFACA